MENNFTYRGLRQEVWKVVSPFKVFQIVPGNVCFVETLEGQRLMKALNRILKKYYPIVWQKA
jgi:hypothetical protein